MHDTNSMPVHDQAPGSGLALTLLGGIAGVTTIVAACLTWLILTQPARVTLALSQGNLDLARELARALIDVVSRALSWL
jgi:hypothetical protein